MDGGTGFMYISRMPEGISRHDDWHSTRPPIAPHLLVCVWCALTKWEHEELAAPFWRWYHNDRIGASLIMHGKRIALQPGRVYLLPPHTSFGTTSRGKIGHLYLHFTLGLDRPAPSGDVHAHQPGPEGLSRIRRLTTLLRQGAPGLEAGFLAHSLVGDALSRLPASYWEGLYSNEKLERVLRRLHEDPGLPGGNTALARTAGMNTNAFIRMFRASVGDTPHRYRLRLRLERAAGLLRDDRLSLAQIAEAAGFCDPFHFSRSFKRILGTSPSAYRRLSFVPTLRTEANLPS